MEKRWGVAIATLLLLTGCSQNKPTDRQEPVKVGVVTVRNGSVESHRTYVGTVEEASSTPVSFGKGGRVKAVYVRDGQHVKAGDLLATVEPQLRSQSTINVAAINHDFSVTPWSNYGSGTTVSAPGEGIISSVPPCAYDFQDGTSMAAPIVSGIVALMKSVNKNVTVAQAKEALMTSGRNASGGQQAGPIVQADKALRMIK